MSGGFPLLGDVCNAKSVGTGTNSMGAAIVTSATANTKGSWTELVSATAADCCLLELQCHFNGWNLGGGNAVVAIDIGIGASGSEVVLIPNIVVSPMYLGGLLVDLLLPLQIPVGTRIAARAAAGMSGGGSAQTCYVNLTLFDGSFEMGEGAAGVDALCFNASNTAGLVIAGHATANTKTAYAELIASTTKDYLGFFIILDTAYSMSETELAFDLAIGGSGSEQIILPNRSFNFGATNQAQNFGYPYTQFYPIKIPAGTRIAARYSMRRTGTKDLGVNLYGVF